MIINPYLFGGNLLLDIYPNAAVAYSLRKLRTAYSGSSIRVRRSSDNAEQDIGFVGNDLDTASLLTFCGVANGFIARWYDQSTNANNSTNATAAQQAQVVSNGNLVLDPNNNKLSSQWTNDSYVMTTGISINQKFLFTEVVNRAATNNSVLPTGNLSAAFYIVRWTSTGNIETIIGSGSATVTHATADTATGDYIISALRDGSNVVKAWKNGSALTTGTSVGTTPSWTRFGSAITISSTCYYQEMIFWNTDLESSRSAIETAINNYYSVY
jgi:hypothetical protein